MSDERTDNGIQPGGGFDDDRLLAYALGLDDDHGLEAAAAGDAALRARIAAMRADVGAVGAGLDRVVPAPPDEYTELSGAQWGELRELVAAPAAPRRRPMWLRVLVPAAAIALVLVAGVVGLQRLGTVGGNDAATVTDDEKALESDGRQSGGTEGGAAEGAGAPSLDATVPGSAAYETVVVARAEPPFGGRQRFEVLRVLRGEAGAEVSLAMVDRALAPDTLAILYLRPTGHANDAPSAPSPASTGTPLIVAGKVVRYTFMGEPALARRLPADTDLETIALP
jgi:hypothetical protein